MNRLKVVNDSSSLQIYKIVEIYRQHKLIELYVLKLLWYNKEILLTASSQMTLEIKHGGFFEGDFIEINKVDSEGIIFKKIDKSIIDTTKWDKCRANINLQILLDYKLTNFLNDTLPENRNLQYTIDEIDLDPIYQDNIFIHKYRVLDTHEEIPCISSPITAPFIGQIQQKTRINLYPGVYNPFFFIIVSYDIGIAKIVFWKENILKYSNLEVGDTIYVKTFRKKKKTELCSKLTYNTFTETMYFDVDEIVSNEIYKVSISLNKDIFRIFDTIQGHVIYSSVILKNNYNGMYHEYQFLKLLHKDTIKYVVLFNNSQKEFYKLRNKNIILYEMRYIKRGEINLYISTIYTRIKIEHDKICCKKYFNVFDNKTITKHFQYVSAERGLSYLPDIFNTLDDLKDSIEIFGGQSKQVDFFFMPMQTTIEELTNSFNKETKSIYDLSINEIKKFFFINTIQEIIETNIYIDYIIINNKKEVLNKTQKVYQIILKNDHFIYYTENLFIPNYNTIDIIKNLQHVRSILFVDAIRINNTEIMIYLTGGFKYE